MRLVDSVASWVDEVWDFFTAWFHAMVLDVGKITIFTYESLLLLRKKPSRLVEIIRHMEFIGNQSVGIIVLTSLFTGLALSFQIYLGFKMFNAVNMVGSVVALGITRELGPVLTGLIVAARAGGAMAARLGTMRVNEQIDALDVMGVNTRQYLIGPRVVAAVICMPLLTAIFDFVAMVGSYILCVKIVQIDNAIFMQKIADIAEVKHIMEGLFKAMFFGLFFAAICTFRGFHTTGGAKGVGDATNMGVVQSMVMIIIIDYFITNLIRIYYLAMGIA